MDIRTILIVITLTGTPAYAARLFQLASSQFEEPLVATASTSRKEDDALLAAIQAYRKQPVEDDFRPLDAFLSDYPRSGWRVALLTNLGLSYYHYGYFSKAIDSWERAWQAGRPVTETRAKALVDRAVGELARMHARLGHYERLATLFDEIGDRPVTGPATEAIQGAREGLWLMRNEPGVAYLCGPMALKNLLLSQGAPFERVQFLDAVRSGLRGVSLAEVARLAETAKLPYRLVFRDADQPIPVPSIVHWKVTHFAALVEEADGRFHVQDPTFGHDLWVTRAALESESSGYFLIPAETADVGWRSVSAAEASEVRGMGNTGSSQQGAVKRNDRKTGQGCKSRRGMCGYDIHEMAVSLNLNDTPVGYAPPRGPAVYVTLTYNQREADQPANFSWFNVSPKWTLNWLSYIQDDPGNARANALHYVAGGGSVTYTGFNATTNAWARERGDASLLVRTSTSPISYERSLADGSREIYSQSNGATTNPRRVFLTQIIDPAGNAVVLTYDTQLRLTAITDALKRVTKLSYELTAQPLLITAITDPFGRSARIAYDASGRLIQITQIDYNTLGNVTRTVDPLGRETQFVYDANLIDILQVKQKTSATGFSTIAEFTYNSQHLPLTKKDAAGQITTYAYNAAGQPVQITNALGQVTRFEYDSLGYLTRVVNPNNQTAASFTYDSAGRLATRTDAEGLFVSFSYDALDRITKETYADGSTRDYTWDKLDMVTVRDRQGRATHYTYDAVRNLVDVADPMGRHTKFGYYENGKVKSLTDPNGNVTTWDIDLQGRVTAKHYPDGRQMIKTYEGTTSRIKSITDALGQKEQFTYTIDNQIAAIDHFNAQNPTPNLRFTYDPYFKRMASMTDGSGTTQYQYQPPGATGALQLAQEIGSFSNATIAYKYDALDRVIGRTVDSSAESFAYDTLGRLISHTSDLGAFDLGYLGQTGQMTSRHLRGTALRTDWTFETNTNDRRLAAITNGGAARGYQYTTTPENLLSRLVETATTDGAAPVQSWDFSYDAADRILQRTSSGGQQYSYGYDATDNIMLQQGVPGALSASYNSVNQITSLSNGQSFVYDANGNLTGDGARTFSWDAENRLIAVTTKADPPQTTTFRYDGLGRRIAIVAPDGAETRYLWCGEALCQSRTVGDVVLRRYYSEGELISGGAGMLYGQDHLGSVRDVLSVADGSLVASYDYDTYGNPVQTPAPAGTDFRYAGMFYEPNSGLYLTHYRAYDPVTARWLSRDPMEEGGGMNLYSYVSGNPETRTDPLGLLCVNRNPRRPNPLWQLLTSMFNVTRASVSSLDTWFGSFLPFVEMNGYNVSEGWGFLSFATNLAKWAQDPSVEGYLAAFNSIAVMATSELGVALGLGLASANFGYNLVGGAYGVASQWFGEEAVARFITGPFGVIGNYASNQAASLGYGIYHGLNIIYDYFSNQAASLGYRIYHGLNATYDYVY